MEVPEQRQRYRNMRSRIGRAGGLMERRAKPGSCAWARASLMRTDQSAAAGIRNQSYCAWQIELEVTKGRQSRSGCNHTDLAERSGARPV